MVVCSHCHTEVDEAEVHESGGFSSCPACGSVWEDLAFSSDVQFLKGADGEGEMTGQFVSETGQVRGVGRMAGGRYYPSAGDSHDAAASKGRNELAAMIDHFHIRPREDSLGAAHRLYKLALAQGFTKGRVVAQVAACCLYIICRMDDKPFMLLDYSDLLQVNVFVLGAVYLQLIELLRLEDSHALSKPVDPSLYIHRFVEKLKLAEKKTIITNTALRLIASMKRDWMQTGRRPSGVCGAALWLAAHIHGVALLKTQVVRVVCVGWSTLDQRLREFVRTPSAALTPKEFEDAAEAAQEEMDTLMAQLEAAHQQRKSLPPAEGGGCAHVAGHTTPHFAAGMCRKCFKEFLQAGGNLWGQAADPPAFTAARQREKAAVAQLQGADRMEMLMLEAAPNPEEEHRMLLLEAAAAKAAKGAKGAKGGRGGRGQGRPRTKADALAAFKPAEEAAEVAELDHQLADMRAQVAGDALVEEGPQLDEGQRTLGAGLLAFGTAVAIPTKQQRLEAQAAAAGSTLAGSKRSHSQTGSNGAAAAVAGWGRGRQGGPHWAGAAGLAECGFLGA